jgi:hypothetical protein
MRVFRTYLREAWARALGTQVDPQSDRPTG